MASVTSLGVHTPAALLYLINEGFLPNDPKPCEYQWETYVWDSDRDDGDGVEEEVLATKDTVVWSQGRFIRNVYRFSQEGEDVAHAVLTRFPKPSEARPQLKDVRSVYKVREPHGDTTGLANRFQLVDEGNQQKASSPSLAKALVVILKTKAHVFFLQGSSHILDLPFEIERAVPAPVGLVLQRKRTPALEAPPTPQLPRVPLNSFFSSQTQPSSSYLQSPSLNKSFARVRQLGPQLLHSDARLDALFRDVISGAEQSRDDDVAALYSLTDPLADFGVVTYSFEHQRLRMSGKARPGISVGFEGLDPAEEIVYMSSKHELTAIPASGSERLFFLVTVNQETSTMTVWHAWYLEEKSLRTLLKLRAANKAAKARRRSSFLSTNVGTGTATPAVRHRDGARESFAAPGTLRLPGEPLTTQPTQPASRKPTQEEEAEAMASQMDPDYQPTGSQQPARENRRISSMNTDVRVGHGTAGASFGPTGTRRHTSFGAPNERRSTGHRRSRGSTPGSVFSRSVGADDSLMDLDSTMDYDDDETLDGIVRHIRATLESCNIDNVFGSLEEGFKRELVLRKVHSCSLGSEMWSQGAAPRASYSYKVACLSNPQPPRDPEKTILKMYIYCQETKTLRCLGLQIHQRPLWPETLESPTISIPALVSDEELGRCEDIVKLQDSGTDALLLGGQGLVFSTTHQSVCPLPPSRPYRRYNAMDASLSHHNMDKDVGRNRIIQPPAGVKSLGYAGTRGSFDEITTGGEHHRRRLQLRPREAFIERILEVFELVLPLSDAQTARTNWCRAYASLGERRGWASATACSAETIALVTTVFLFVSQLIDAKARAALKMYKLATAEAGRSSNTRGILQTDSPKQKHSSALLWTRTDKPHRQSSLVKEHHRDNLLLIAAALADEMTEASDSQRHPHDLDEGSIIVATKLMLSLHVMREEHKLSLTSSHSEFHMVLAPVIAQLGGLLGLHGWSNARNGYFDLEGAGEDRWAYVKPESGRASRVALAQEPVGIFQWFERALTTRSLDAYPTLAAVVQFGDEARIMNAYVQHISAKTPRIKLLHDLLNATSALTADYVHVVEKLAEFNVSPEHLDTFPESFAAPFKEAIARCETNPPSTWSQGLLQLVGRNDLVRGDSSRSPSSSRQPVTVQSGPLDIQTICHELHHPTQNLKTREAGRHTVSQLIFSKDRRLVEATSLMHFNIPQIAECPKQPEWTEAQHFDHQRRVMYFVTIRMIALPAGDGMVHYSSRTPLLTEKYPLPGFNSTVIMQPMGHTLTADRTGLTEDKVNWAYFHAGASAGLRLSQKTKGIDTSWIAFNKPNDLTNRHAGLLLALGLNGHLKNVAKWLSFKYLTPKHTMTSIGLLLGLSASYLGTMDGLITRMLSVHITRMLPPGAAELNVSAVTQTAGLMGIGLLYYNTQHRRMSEVMLSEIEHMEVEDPDSGPDPLRDESYRLAAGFALGYINLGKGDDLRGLHGMQLSERLLGVAVGPRPVQAVHVFDRAIAGAVIAIALVYMKTGNKAVATKIDIPDTEAQFDHVRPDVLLLRAMTKHVIMWDDIVARAPSKSMQGWIGDNLPLCYRDRWRQLLNAAEGQKSIDSAYIPLFSVYAGLAWALGLKYAGSGNQYARDDILRLLNIFHTACDGSNAYYYNGNLGRSALRRCMDVLALSAAMVMAGTGDIVTFRYLRRMHGRADNDTPYGSHLAAHMAIGALFLGGGTFTFGNSNLAVASLICAFYPLFPTDVHDNRVHLQAFRHFWVFAAEPRCIVIEDIDTQRPIHMDIRVTLRDGQVQHLQAPCLLPALGSIATVQTADSAYWQVTLDFAHNPAQLAAFRQDQRVFVRHCPATEAHSSAFSTSLAALEASLAATSTRSARAQQLWRSVFQLPTFRDLDQADLELMLPTDAHSSAYLDERSTSIDARMVLAKAADAGNESRDALWNLRLLFAWADRAKEQGDGKLRWLGTEVIEALKAKVESRMREYAEAAESQRS